MAEEGETGHVESAAMLMVGEETQQALPEGQVFALNSKRLLAVHVKAVAEGMGLPTKAATDELRQLIDGHLSEQGREPPNVQVVIQEEGKEFVSLYLVDESGVFKEIKVVKAGKVEHGEGSDSESSSDSHSDHDSEGGAPEETTAAAVEALQQQLEAKEAEHVLVVQEKDQEIERLRAELSREKSRYKQLWKMNCHQLNVHESELHDKDVEIIRLQNCLHVAEARVVTPVSETETTDRGPPPAPVTPPVPVTPPASDTRRVPVTPPAPVHVSSRTGEGVVSERRPVPESSDAVPTAMSVAVKEASVEPAGVVSVQRKGKAPPIDQFTGENPEIRFEDWLPSLTRASRWNRWTPEEDLIQLAGYLRGRALQEWELMEDSEKSDWSRAIDVLRARLDPSNKILAAQDFRHTMQAENESVSDFIRRIERAFRIAYNSKEISKETREAFLYGQLQEGLRNDLMQSPSVSGALSYKELCMAAKNEEKRKAELRKRRTYRSTSTPAPDQSQKRDSVKRRDVRDSRPTRTRPPSTGADQVQHSRSTHKPIQIDSNTCLRCGQLGHKANTCTSQLPGVCYVCHNPGHRAKDCKQQKSESRGKRVTNRQVVVDNTPSSAAELLPSDSENGVGLVRVECTGSPKCAQVMIQGVQACGVVDSGADITIIGRDLFTTIATANKLKKRDLKKPDKVPKTYDRRTFTLDGKLELELSFEDKTLTTNVYVKLDAYDQLLLSEGVCHSLGIINYHPSVVPYNRVKERRESPQPVPTVAGDREVEPSAVVPEPVELRTVRVQLVQTETVLPYQEKVVPVKCDKEVSGLVVVEPKHLLDEGAVTQATLINPEGHAYVCIANVTGYTQHLSENLEVGQATEASMVLTEQPSDHGDTSVGTITSDDDLKMTFENVEARKAKIRTLFQDKLRLPREQGTKLCELLRKYHTAFSLEENERGETDLIQLEIDTGDASPKKQHARRMPFSVREEISRQLQKMQQAGVIQPSKSPWASPVVLVRKKDGSHRFCVDFRELNAVTRKDTFPLPRVDDLLDQLGSSQFFSTLDLAAGYWQIKMHPESSPKTAFVTHEGLHEFTVMPFGLTNAPAAFQRVMQQVVMGLNTADAPNFVSVYIDDVLVFSRTLEEHLDHLERVLKRLIEVGLKLKPQKCHFVRQEVGFLGHVITPQGLKTSEQHILAVREFPVPDSVRAVRQFMGLCSYYRRFVKGFASIARPLHALTRKGASFSWSEGCEHAFQELKRRLCESPILAYPAFDKQFVLETDASIKGIGAVLSQTQSDGKLHPIAFASRALNGAEKNYCITDLETLAVVWAIMHFKTYMYGQKVTIYTDHAAVKAVLQKPNTSGRHARWWTQVYGSGLGEVQIVYRAGKENALADALSRNPQGPPPEEGLAEGESQVAQIGASESTENQLSDLLQLVPPTPSDGNQTPTVISEQKRDPVLQAMIQYQKKGVLPGDPLLAKRIAAQATQFELVDGVLCFIDLKRRNKKRVVVPSHLREKLIGEVHGGPMSGHFATTRIFTTLSRTWWWDGMYQDVNRHCKTCPQCVMVTGAGRPGHPPLKPIPVSRPFQIMGIDIMDLPRTNQGNKHVIVVQDFLTKWPFVFAVPDQKTHRIARLIVEEIVPMVGVPEALLSDRGTNLLSHLMRDVCELLGVEKLNTTAYHPQCNGQVERFNRTLKTMIRKHVSKFGAQWDKYLHGLVWAYRNTPHDSTNEKPSFLLFGVDCRYPTEAALLPPHSCDPALVEDYREELVLSLSHARTLAAQCMSKAQDRYKANYDQHTRTNQYKVGEWILIRFPQEETGANRKLSRPWHGPYRVVSSDETGVVATKVYEPSNKNIQVHQSRVTRCPVGFPPGYYWYGTSRAAPGRPPKWVDQFVSAQTTTVSPDSASVTAESEEVSTTPEDEVEVIPEQELEDEPELERDPVPEPQPEPFRRTRSRVIKQPQRLMTITANARDELD